MKLDEPLNLVTVANGSALVLFERELERVIENVVDPNTDEDTKRKITLTFTFKPDNKRRSMKIDVDAECRLAPAKSESTLAFVALNGTTGKHVAVEDDPRQRALEWGEVPKPTAIEGGKGAEASAQEKA